MRGLLGALQFLTVIPVRLRAHSPGHSAAWFPVVGALIGWLTLATLILAEQLLPVPLAAIVAALFSILITGGLHEDGLADCADAFRAGRPRDRILAILHDSRVGAFGALALIFSAGIRWSAYAQMPAESLPAVISAPALGRAAMVALAWIARPAGDGLGFAFSVDLSTSAALAAIAIGCVFSIPMGLVAGAIAGAGAALAVVVAHLYFRARLGGVTGDCLGATCQVVELFVLVAAVR